jgi:hypothetical protein
MVSKKFKIAVKLDPRRQYQIAWEAGVNPTVLSQIVTGYIRPDVGDVRVLKVGRLLGLKDSECFSKERHNNE